MGVGVGTILIGETELSSISITLITIACLVLGGFLIATGITTKHKVQEVIKEEVKNEDDEEDSDNNSESGI